MIELKQPVSPAMTHTSLQRSTQAAFLHRCVSLNDRHSTQVFTFILPPHLLKGYLPECCSKDFAYAYQKWRVIFTRDERHLGCFLELRSPAERTEVRLDFSFTVLNRNHFTGNETYQERSAVFGPSCIQFGRATCLCVADLEQRGFMFSDGRALVEVELRSFGTEFREEILAAHREARDQLDADNIESSYFAFAGCDWSLVVNIREPDGCGRQRPCQPSLLMQRHNCFDHLCRIRYRASFQAGDSVYHTEVIDQLLDAKGYGPAQAIGQAATGLLAGVSRRKTLRLSVSLLSVWPVTPVDLIPTSRNKSAARCYDTDKQQWVVESDILGRQLRLRLFYSDVKNVPRHFARQVCWNACVVPADRGRPPVPALNGPFTGYYSQKDGDGGFEVEMELPVEEICDDNAGYTEPRTGCLTVHIEWLHSHLIYHDFYHHYDDIIRLHKHQMSREVCTLQSENYSLEKKLFNYQMSISRQDACGIGAASAGCIDNSGSGGCSGVAICSGSNDAEVVKQASFEAVSSNDSGISTGEATGAAVSAGASGRRPSHRRLLPMQPYSDASAPCGTNGRQLF